MSNKRVLMDRLERVKDAQNQHDISLSAVKRECQAVERQCTSLKLEVMKLGKQMDKLKNLLLSRGLSADMMDQWLEQADPSQPHQPVSTCPLFVIYYIAVKKNEFLNLSFYELW